MREYPFMDLDVKQRAELTAAVEGISSKVEDIQRLLDVQCAVSMLSLAVSATEAGLITPKTKLAETIKQVLSVRGIDVDVVKK